MAFETAAWADMMTDSATVTPASGRNGYGEEAHAGTPVVYKGHVSYAPRRVVNTEGELVTSSATFIVAGIATIGLEDHVTLSNGRVYNVVSIKTFHDESGPHHMSLSLV